MSAYVVSLAHVRQMVHLALDGPGDRAPQYPGDGWTAPGYVYAGTDGLVHVSIRDVDPDRLVGMLVAECVRSVAYRYPDDAPGELPGPTDRYYLEPDRLTYEQPRHTATAAQGIVLLGGYGYQSCEHPGWHASEAREYVTALTDALVACLPEVRAAETWSWDTA